MKKVKIVKMVRKRKQFFLSDLLATYQVDPSLRPDHIKNILSRIYHQANVLGIDSERAISNMATGSPDTVRSMRRQYETGKQHSADTSTLQQLAVPLRVNVKWLQFGMGPREASAEHSTASSPMRTIPRGHIADGVPALQVRGTVVVDGWFGEGAGQVAAGNAPPPDPAFAPSAQFALLVGDDSVNRFAQSGDYLIAIDPSVVKVEPAEHLVVVSRMMKDTNLRELTVRRATPNGTDLVLRYESNEMRFKEKPEPHISEPGISIVGVVIAVYRRVA